MPIIRISGGMFCRAEEVAKAAAETLGWKVIKDEDVATKTGEKLGIPASKVQRALEGGASFFNNLTMERERIISGLKAVLAGMVAEDNFIIQGWAGHLIPAEISHVLRVCAVADRVFRLEAACKAGFGRNRAEKRIKQGDEAAARWTGLLFNKGPWDPELYDIVLPMNKLGEEEARKTIIEHAKSDAVKPTPASQAAARDFALAAEVELTLGKNGKDVAVSARDGKVTLTINKNTLMLDRLKEDLQKMAKKTPGVKDVETKVGPGFYQPEVYRHLDGEVPRKVLLVDDEREFVQTLSERLSMREMEPTVVYDGEQALDRVKTEEPEVIVLDLKMPGIDGIEVLRRLKKDHPGVEVIILTGHGTEKDEKVCLDLGAFAYLQKPVDIEKLSQCMKDAYTRIKEKKGGGETA